MDTPQYLYTFGYEGLDIEAFIARLHQAGVHSVVDVRDLPLSRKKGFSKTRFSSLLNQAGIEYLHAPALGCPKPIRHQYRADGDWARYSHAFLTYLATQKDNLRDLARIALSRTACLVCYEADFNLCHRTYVARAAHRLGAPEVGHLSPRTMIPDLPLQRAA